MAAPRSTASRYASFVVGGLVVGVDIAVVQEVVRWRGTTPVPLAHECVVGLINLRGQIVTAIDLRRRLGLPGRAVGAQAFNVVVRVDDRPVSLVVDGCGDVVSVDGPPDAPPQTLAGSARELITGVHQLDGCLLLVLDAGAAVELAEVTADLGAAQGKAEPSHAPGGSSR
jgi:purine-binding chemotaxis protein CheW